MKKTSIKYIIVIITILIMILFTLANYSNSASTYYQYIKTGIDQFPTSYQTKLKQIASKYPNWKFQAYYTGISWDDLISSQRDESIHRNRVTVNAPYSWKNECGFVENGWACASDASVKYYLDPRNFLNETQIFQFVESSYNSSVQTLSAIQSSVKGTFLDNTITCKDFNGKTVTMSYSQIILKAAQESNISAFYIKSKIIQEVGVNGSGSVSGNYPGYKGYYNFYNFGADDTGDPIANGLQYAKDNGWDSQYKAIIGGAKTIGKNYIEAGQNTAYFNKWDVVGTKILKDGESQTVNRNDLFWHQYMTNIQDPTSQSSSIRKLYENSLKSNITFIIPVYNNMPASNPMPQDVKVQSISMEQSKVILSINEKRTMNVTFNPSNASNKNLIWTSSNSDVVRVWNGDYRGLKEGSSVITAKTVDGGKVASFTVYVRNPQKKYVTNISIEKDSYIVKEDEALDIKFTYTPENSANAEFEWTSSNDSILRVWGPRFRALKEGTAYIIVRTTDGTVETKAKVTVKSKNPSYVTSINLPKKEYAVTINDAVDIPFTYTPTNAINAEFEWTSSNDSILRVWGPRFRALKEGTAYVIVKTTDGRMEEKVKVTVSKTGKVQSINLSKNEYTVNINDAMDISFTYSPTNAINAEFEWTSSNDSILRVWGPRFRALKEGTAYVIVKTTDGTVQEKIKVTVNAKSTKKVETINLTQKEYNVKVNEAIDIPFTYSPTNAINAEFEWTSSNDSILRVWGPRFRALKAGTAYVVVKTTDETVQEKIKVTVNAKSTKKVETINLTQKEYNVKVNEAIDIPFTYSPTNAINAEFEWTSSNDSILRVWGPRFRALKKGTAYVVVKTTDGTIQEKIKVVIQ